MGIEIKLIVDWNGIELGLEWKFMGIVIKLNGDSWIWIEVGIKMHGDCNDTKWGL